MGSSSMVPTVIDDYLVLSILLSHALRKIVLTSSVLMLLSKAHYCTMAPDGTCTHPIGLIDLFLSCRDGISLAFYTTLRGRMRVDGLSLAPAPKTESLR